MGGKRAGGEVVKRGGGGGGEEDIKVSFKLLRHEIIYKGWR